MLRSRQACDILSLLLHRKPAQNSVTSALGVSVGHRDCPERVQKCYRLLKGGPDRAAMNKLFQSIVESEHNNLELIRTFVFCKAFVNSSAGHPILASIDTGNTPAVKLLLEGRAISHTLSEALIAAVQTLSRPTSRTCI